MKKVICLIVLLMVVLSGSSPIRKEVELSPNCKGEDDDSCMVKKSNKTIKNPGGGFDVHEYRTMRLPISALSEMLKDKSIFFIVNIDIDIAQGLHIIDKPSALYKDRLDIKWDIVADYSHDWGYLTLHLFLRNLESGDHCLLHIEVRTNRTIYKTPSEIWFPDIINDPKLRDITALSNVNPAKTTTSDELSIEIKTDHGQISENETIQERGENTTTINKDDLVHQQYENILNNLSNIESMIVMMKEKLIILIIMIAFTGICVLVWKLTSNLYHEYKQGNNKAGHDIRWRDIKWRDGKLHVYMSITNDLQGTDSPITSQEMQVCINEGPQDQELYIPPGYKLSAFSEKQGNLLKFKMKENS